MSDLEFYDIYDIWYNRPWFLKVGPYIVGVLLTMIFVVILWRYIKKTWYKKNSWDMALQRLELLQHLLRGNLVSHKDFYCELTLLLKEYLLARYNINVIGKTDLELLTDLDGCEIPGHVIDDLKNIFGGTSIIKFSNYGGVHVLVQEDLARSIRAIKSTIPKK